MKPQTLLMVSLGLVGVLLGGCVQYPAGTREHPVEEGIIYAVEYEVGNGQTEGFTRVNNPTAVPGGKGKSNVDAYGKLYRDFLLIRFQDTPDLGYQAIPVQRLIFVQFGHGGVRQVESAAKTG